MSDISNLGKKSEAKLRQWLTQPEKGFYMMRLPDQLTGFYGSTNMCDFLLYKKPYFYPIESKATYSDRFDFSMLTETQHNDMLKASEVEGIIPYVAVLFATYKEMYLIKVTDIAELESKGKKSLNIKKIKNWDIPYIKVRTLLSRKELLDYDPDHAVEIFGDTSNEDS